MDSTTRTTAGVETERGGSHPLAGVGVFYGWIVVLIAAVGLFFSGPGQTFSISVFVDAYIAEFGWSRSVVSTLYSTATLIAGLGLFLVGRLVDRFGHRAMAVGVGLALGAAALWNSFVATPVMLFAGFLMLRLFGQGSMSLLPTTLVPQWFVEKRGRAMSIMAVGGVLGAALIPPFNTWLIAQWGWQTAWRVWAVLLCAVFVPLARYFIRNRPEELGLLPDDAEGPTTADPLSSAPKGVQAADPEVSWTLREAMGTRAFWFVLLAALVPAMVNTGLIFHLFSILAEAGVERATAAVVLSLMAVVSFPMTFVAGFVLDYVPVRYVLTGVFLAQLGLMALLLNVHTAAAAIAFGVMRGVIRGFEGMGLKLVWPNYFGRQHLGSIGGVAMTSSVIGSSLGPLPFGFAYDFFGGYHQIILLMMLFPLLGAVALMSSPPPEKD